MPRPPIRPAAHVAALAALTLGLAACGSGGPAEPEGSGQPAGPPKPQVVASTDVWGSVAQAVGGDRVDVTSIIDNPDGDPHGYESTPADAAAAGKAQLLLRNGGGYDEFMTQLVEASGNRAPVVYAVQLSGAAAEKAPEPGAEQGEHAGEAPGEHAEHAGEAPDAHAGETPAEHAEHAGEAPDAHGGAGHEHGAVNEHVWYSLPTAQKVGKAVAAELGRIDPAGAAEYTANAERFAAEVAQLETRAKAIGTAHRGATVAVTEPIPDYLLQTAALRDVTPSEFSASIEEGNDPPAAVLQQMLGVLGAKPPVGALVLNAQTQSATTDQVRDAATKAGIPVVEMTETLPDGAPGYTAWMGGQIDRLSAALDRR